MTAEILILVPVLNRPQNARPLVESLIASGSNARIAFVCSPDDRIEESACIAAISLRAQYLDAVFTVDDEPGPGDYAKKIQHGYDKGFDFDIPYVLLAADDLQFHPDWDTAALAVFAETGCGVVGTADLGNPEVKAGRHSTHPFVSREYINAQGGVVGQPGQVYFTGYEHNYVDVELVQTAQARGEYQHCHESRVQHRHPLWDRSVPRDETYAKGRAGFQADRALFESRKHLWLEEVRA